MRDNEKVQDQWTRKFHGVKDLYRTEWWGKLAGNMAGRDNGLHLHLWTAKALIAGYRYGCGSE